VAIRGSVLHYGVGELRRRESDLNGAVWPTTSSSATVLEGDHMSTTTAIGAVTASQGAPFEVRNLTVDDPRDDEIIVRIVASGICHTDVSAQNQVIPFPLPALLGHEGAGIVERVGRGVSTLKEGDHVVVSFNFCGECAQCITGRPVQCDTWVPRNLVGGFRMDGSSPMRLSDGGPLHTHFFGQSSFATRAVVRAAAAIPVPKDAPLPMLAPLVCGFQTGAATMFQVLAPQLGNTVVVFGAGGVGLSAVMAARLTPATRVIVVDVVPERLALATELGATHTVNAANDDSVEAIMEITGGRGADRILEATGNTAVLKQALTVTGMDAVVAIVGAPPFGSEVGVDVLDAIVKGPRIIGVNQGRSVPRVVIPALIDHFLAGRMPFDKLIKTYPLADINDAIHDMHTGATIKPVLLMPESD
jgi:aryl-alcohol dehydrogenase